MAMNFQRDEKSPSNSTIASPRHPRAFWFFFWGEFAERSSFYGMRAILPLYLTAALHFPDATAGAIYYRFKMACYFLPLVGGFLADRYFGKYWTIVGFSIPYVLGHFILGVPTPACLTVALVLLACGSGVIKPNISSLMGLTYDQQRPGNALLRTAAFLWFYFAINVGALISQFALPTLRDDYGYALAFQFPAWLMMASLGIFALGKPYYAIDVIQRSPITPNQWKDRRAALAAVFQVFSLMVFFWVAYEQNDSLWVYFARDYVNCTVPFLQRAVPPDQIQFLNALFVLILIPLFRWLFAKLDPSARRFTAMVKMLLGFAATTAAVAIVSLAGYLAESSEITDAALPELRSLDHLQRLDLSRTRTTTAGIEQLRAALPRLDVVRDTPNLGGPQPAESAAAKTDQAENERSRNLAHKIVTADDLKKLGAIQSLEMLDLSFTNMTDDELRELRGLTQLKSLNLTHTLVTDAGLDQLLTLTNLQTLNLSDTKITDAGVLELARLTNLEELDLSGTQISSRGTKDLRPLTNLRSLNLSFTHPRVSIFWLVIAYIVLTVGEVLVYGTGLELAYAMAPANMKSFITACFLLTNTLGNFINTGLSQLYGGSLSDPPDKRGLLAPSEFFGMTMSLVAVATVAFYFVGRRYDRSANANDALDNNNA